VSQACRDEVSLGTFTVSGFCFVANTELTAPLYGEHNEWKNFKFMEIICSTL